MSEYLYTHDALTVPRGCRCGALLESRRGPCRYHSTSPRSATDGFLILKDAAASDAIARRCSVHRDARGLLERAERARGPTTGACIATSVGCARGGWSPAHLDLLREPRLAAAIRCLAGCRGARGVVHASRSADPGAS